MANELNQNQNRRIQSYQYDSLRYNQLIDNYIYFYQLDEFCILPLYPDSITDSTGSTFAQTNSLSRSAPVFTYSNSGPRQVNFNFDLHRDLMNDLNVNRSNFNYSKGNMVDKNNLLATTNLGDDPYVNSLNGQSKVVNYEKIDYIDTLINYLQAIALPKYREYSSGSRSVLPPVVGVRLGRDLFIRGPVTSGINVTYNKPILDNGKYARVSISFTVSEMDPYDASTIKKIGGFRQVCGGSFYDQTNASQLSAGSGSQTVLLDSFSPTDNMKKQNHILN